ncbi:RDD family protein [Acinetobacter lanii]|uniref:RDD family protein n=1 Tax=Acinetobacter lanii TaxID=2715163 RepID=A0A6G8S312_9GAMM|nr:RDD family protein [Acinetobacter lanii]QIO08562.1 RDD family protein [Acinetobacter lanii]
MQIYLARNNQQAGPYTVEQINQMLASQQVLLTDLAWYQGMPEWKALGEITQGKLVFEPIGYQQNSNLSPSDNRLNNNNSNADQNPTIRHIGVNKKNKPELASIGSRVAAKLIDFLFWIPSLAMPSFFLDKSQIDQLAVIQQKMQAATTSDQAIALQSELFSLIPMEAWQAMGIYVVLMLIMQAIFISKSGQSIGKKLVKIQIVDAETDQKVNLMRGFSLRSVIFIVLNLVFFPFITVVDHVFALSKKRQTLHDKLAKTKVIKRQN